MKITKLLILFFTLCSFGCIDYFMPGAKEYYEISRTMGADNTVANKKLSSYPVEKQVEIYLYGNCCVEGGAWIGALFRREGERKIPYIIQRMEVFPDDIRNKEALIEALYLIDKDCQCLKKSPEYIKILEVVGEKIKTEESSLENEFKQNYINLYWDYLVMIKSNS